MTKLSTLREIASQLIHVKKNWLKIGFFMLMYVALLSSSPYFYKLLIDSLEANIGSWNFNKEIAIIIWIWFLIITATVWVRYIYGMILLTLTQKDWFIFLIKSMKMMMRLPIDYHIGLQHGEKQKIIDRASEAVWDLGDKWFLWIIPRTLVAIILIISGLMIDVHMTIISLLLLPIAIILIQKIGNKAYINQKSANIYWDSLFNRITDSFWNLKIIRIFSREKHEATILENRFSQAQAAQYNIRKLWLVFYGVDGFIISLSQAITLSGGIYLILKDQISLGTLFFFISFTEKIYGPIFEIFRWAQEMMIHIAGYEKMQALYQMNPETDTGKQEFKGIEKSLTFENVTFNYPSTTREVLKWVNIEIKKWERIALIGHTGSGKSTIVQILMRFYDVTTGSISIDGKNINDFTLESYRSGFASVFQDTTLFNESIRHNLEYIRDGLTDAEIRKACKQANILDFIESLPDGWETEVGERGLKLSWWEKQRIAIARAILADPEILILDEATSALDTETERLIQDSLETLMKDRTSIIIAHRLSTIQHVDRIYMLEGGQVIAHGSHRELLKSNKKYQHMIQLQHDGFVGEENY
jgi:ABC-type multidrug transport system fused ATPase/permease subunit